MKDYLGDGVYADFDGAIVLTAKNGICAQERIVLEPEVYAALARYAQRAWPQAAEAAYPPHLESTPTVANPLRSLPLSESTRAFFRFVAASADADLALAVCEGRMDLRAALATHVPWVDGIRKIDPALAEELVPARLESLAMTAAQKGGAS